MIINYVGNDWIDESVKRKRDYIDSPSFFLNFIVSKVLAKMSGFQQRSDLEWRPTKFPADKEIDSLPSAYRKMAQILNNREIKTLVLMDSRYEYQEQGHGQLEVIFRDYSFLTINLLKLWHPIKKMSSHDAVRRDDEHNRKYLIPEDFHPNALWHSDVARLLSGVLANNLCGFINSI